MKVTVGLLHLIAPPVETMAGGPVLPPSGKTSEWARRSCLMARMDASTLAILWRWELLCGSEQLLFIVEV